MQRNLDHQHYQTGSLKNGDDLHNRNCFAYLKQLAGTLDGYRIDDTTAAQSPLWAKLKKLQELNTISYEDNPTIAYGDWYTDLITVLQDSVDEFNQAVHTLKTLSDQAKKDSDAQAVYLGQLNKLTNFIHTLYANKNNNLERTAAFIPNSLRSLNQTSTQFENGVRTAFITQRKTFKDKLVDRVRFYLNIPRTNKITPQEQGSLFGRLFTILKRRYRPMTETSIPCTRTYGYNEGSDKFPKEYRFGTQAEYDDDGNPRINPIFNLWIKNLESNQPNHHDKIDHVYFNYLGLDRYSVFDKEKPLTLKLQQDLASQKNLAFITLPADMGLMGKNLFSHHAKKNSVNDLRKKIIDIFTCKSTDKFKDFWISDETQMRLYNSLYKNNPFADDFESKREHKLNELFDASLAAMGFTNNLTLSDAEMQATYFHFVKFEFPEFVFKQLNPQSFNMSCKDAIDRGGVSSAYYNLLKSIQNKQPLTEDEFFRALHAAPAMVKGRGMNHHVKLIWNAISHYLDSDKNKNNTDVPTWLKEWRVSNAPSHTKYAYINELNQYLKTKDHEKNNSSRFFIPAHPDADKTELAKKLRQALLSGSTLTLTDAEEIKINDGRLGKIYKAIHKDRILTSENVQIEKTYFMNGESNLR